VVLELKASVEEFVVPASMLFCCARARGRAVVCTVKFAPLLAWPPTFTTTLPVVAPVGTSTVMLVALQPFAIPAGVPLNVTVLAPCAAPKFVPAMVTLVPTVPKTGLRLVMLGGGPTTVKATPLLAIPPTVTTTGPLVAPVGTSTVILVALQLLAVPAGVPLKVTALGPCAAPKFVPVSVTEVPTAPEVGLKLVMPGGGGVTVKPTLLLAIPPTVTTTGPLVAPIGTSTVMLVALQPLAVPAGVPLNVTALAPCAAPKFVPVSVTEVLTDPLVGFRFVMLGGAPPVPLADLNAATAAPQLTLAAKVALAATLPAVP